MDSAFALAALAALAVQVARSRMHLEMLFIDPRDSPRGLAETPLTHHTF